MLEQVVLPANAGPTTPGARRSIAPGNGYIMLTSNGSEGMFPCSLAVARVDTPAYLPSGFIPAPRLAMNPANEMFDWTDLFDDVWSISEVFPVTYPTRKDRQVSPQTLVEYSRSDQAGLCLIYEIVSTRADDVTIVDVHGTLYDARNGAMLIEAHADARVRDITEDQLPPPQPPDRVAVDKRHIDPWFIAQERFRELVRQSILDLVAQDKKILAPRRPQQLIISNPVPPSRRSWRWPN